MANQQSSNRKWLWTSLLGVVLVFGIILGTHLLLRHPPFQRFLLTQIASGSGYDLQAEDLGVRYQDGIEFWATGLDVRAHNAQHQLAAAKTTFTFDVKSLLKGHWAPRRLKMAQPQIKIFAEASSTSKTPSPGKNQTSSPKPIHWESIASKLPVEIHLDHAAVSIDNLAYQLQETDITVMPDPNDPAARNVAISAQILSPSSNASLNVSGWLAAPGITENENIGVLKFSVEKLPLAHLPPSNSFRFQEGLANLTADMTITRSGIKIRNGSVGITQPRFAVQNRPRQKTYSLDQAHLDFDARLEPTAIALDTITLKTPQATLFSSFYYDWIHANGPQMDLSVSSEPLPMDTFKAIFPDIVVPGWIPSEIFPMFTSGKVQLEKFTLKGSVAAIQRLGRKENEDCLYLDARIVDTTAFEARPGPVVENVSGRIQIKNGAFIISEVSGETGESHLTQSGYTIPDLYEHPARHLIALAGDFDLADLQAWHTQPVLPRPLRNVLASFDTFSGQTSGHVTIYLKGPVTAGLTGDITLADNVIERADILLPLKIDTGRIQIPKESSASIAAQGEWGKSTIDLTGSMDLNHFLLGLPRLYDDNMELDARWDLAELNQTVKKHSLGPQWFARTKSAKGSLRSNLTLRKTAKKEGWQYGGGTFEWQKIDLEHPFLKNPVVTQNGRLSLSENGAGDYAINGRWGQSPFDLSGQFQNFFQSWSTQGKTELSADDLAAILTNTKFLTVSTAKPVPVELTADQTDGKLSVLSDLALDGQQITIGDFTIAPPGKDNRLHSQIVYQKGKSVVIQKLQWQYQKERLDVQGTIGSAEKQPTQLTLSAKDFPLDQIGLSYKNKPNKLAGILTSEITATITENRLDTLAINGPLRITNTHLPVDNTPLLESSWDVDVEFNGDRITVHPSTFPLNTGEKLQISGELTGWKEVVGKLTVTLDKLFLDSWAQRLKTTKDAKKPTLKPAETKPTPWAIMPNIDITLFTPTVLWSDRSIGKLNASLRWVGYDGYVDAADLEGEDVTVNVSGQYGWPLSDHGGLSLVTYVHLVDVDSDRLLSGIGVQKNDIHGTLNLEGGLEIEGKTAPQMAQTASGRFKLALTDGFIREPNVLIKVLEFISLENIFIKKPVATLKDQFYYKSIDADFVLEGGVLTTENFFMKSPVFNMGATGKLDLSTMDLNLLLAAQPLNTLDAIVSRVPIAGHILTGKNKALLVYTFEVDGTLTNPKVHQKPFKNLDKAVVGYFQRIFLTPTRVISQVGNYLKGITEKLNSIRRETHGKGGDR